MMTKMIVLWKFEIKDGILTDEIYRNGEDDTGEVPQPWDHHIPKNKLKAIYVQTKGWKKIRKPSERKSIIPGSHICQLRCYCLFEDCVIVILIYFEFQLQGQNGQTCLNHQLYYAPSDDVLVLDKIREKPVRTSKDQWAFSSLKGSMNKITLNKSMHIHEGTPCLVYWYAAQNIWSALIHEGTPCLVQQLECDIELAEKEKAIRLVFRV